MTPLDPKDAIEQPLINNTDFAPSAEPVGKEPKAEAQLEEDEEECEEEEEELPRNQLLRRISPELDLRALNEILRLLASQGVFTNSNRPRNILQDFNVIRATSKFIDGWVPGPRSQRTPPVHVELLNR
jgi:hypothetical protein